MKKAKKKIGEALKPIYFTFLSLGNVIFAILCIYQSHSPLVSSNAVWLSFFICALGIVLLSVCVWAFFVDKELLCKWLITFLIGALFLLVLLFILMKTNFFSIVKDKQKLAEYLQKAGVWMPIAYLLLQFLQVVILPIPSVVSTAVGVVLFGPFLATLYSIIGVMLGTFVAFYIGRKLGSRAVEWLIGKETLYNWQKRLNGKDNFILTLMFILPVFPDDVLCFIAGLSSMSVKYFCGMTFISRIIAITTTCYSIQFIPFNTWWGVSIWIMFAIVIILSFLFIYKNMTSLQRWFSKKRNK